VVESRGADFDTDELAAWHGMLRTHALVIRELDNRLARKHGLAVSEFDVLITLANAPGKALRMTELADQVMLSASGLTRLVGRLERDGLVRRRQDAGDARSYLASLTPAGAAKLRAARATHNAVIRELYLDRLSGDQRRAAGAIWRTVHAG
jgi:DNA-binding MarR family transcriptional regulator